MICSAYCGLCEAPPLCAMNGCDIPSFPVWVSTAALSLKPQRNPSLAGKAYWRLNPTQFKEMNDLHFTGQRSRALQGKHFVFHRLFFNHHFIAAVPVWPVILILGFKNQSDVSQSNGAHGQSETNRLKVIWIRSIQIHLNPQHESYYSSKEVISQLQQMGLAAPQCLNVGSACMMCATTWGLPSEAMWHSPRRNNQSIKDQCHKEGLTLWILPFSTATTKQSFCNTREVSSYAATIHLHFFSWEISQTPGLCFA